MGKLSRRHQDYTGAIIALSQEIESSNARLVVILIAMVQYLQSMRYPGWENKKPLYMDKDVLAISGPICIREFATRVIDARNVSAHRVCTQEYHDRAFIYREKFMDMAHKILNYEASVRANKDAVKRLSVEFWGYPRTLDKFGDVSEIPCMEEINRYDIL